MKLFYTTQEAGLFTVVDTATTCRGILLQLRYSRKTTKDGHVVFKIYLKERIIYAHSIVVGGKIRDIFGIRGNQPTNIRKHLFKYVCLKQKEPLLYIDVAQIPSYKTEKEILDGIIRSGIYVVKSSNDV